MLNRAGSKVLNLLHGQAGGRSGIWNLKCSGFQDRATVCWFCCRDRRLLSIIVGLARPCIVLFYLVVISTFVHITYYHDMAIKSPEPVFAAMSIGAPERSYRDIVSIPYIGEVLSPSPGFENLLYFAK